MDEKDPVGSKPNDDDRDLTAVNPIGVNVRVARVISGVAALILLYWGFTALLDGSFWVALICSMLLVAPVWFAESKQSILDDREASNEYFEKIRERETEEEMSDETVAICRECHEEVNPRVNRCPHCGWKPKKKGGLWWLGTGWLSLTPLAPVGWAMAGKGLKDKHNASKGVSEERQTEDGADSESDDESTNTKDVKSPSSPERTIESLERLQNLRDGDAISEEEFEQMKSEIINS